MIYTLVSSAILAMAKHFLFSSSASFFTLVIDLAYLIYSALQEVNSFLMVLISSRMALLRAFVVFSMIRSFLMTGSVAVAFDLIESTLAFLSYKSDGFLA